jgi:hypothetical protein
MRRPRVKPPVWVTVGIYVFVALRLAFLLWAIPTLSPRMCQWALVWWVVVAALIIFTMVV